MKTSARYFISLLVAAFVLTLALGWAPQTANSKQAGPTDRIGYKSTAKQAVDLGPEIAGMEGRQLRMRMITLQPGGHTPVHSHKNRPAVVYFLQGTDTVTFGDGTKKVFRAGDTSFADTNTVHWHGNNGTEPVILVAVDVFQNKK